jgi:hypothetical protein
MKVISPLAGSLAAPSVGSRLDGRRNHRVLPGFDEHLATGTINCICSLRTQPQSAAPLAILQFDQNFMDFRPAYRFHDFLSLSTKYENEKNTKKPRHRFLGPGPVSLTMTCDAI